MTGLTTPLSRKAVLVAVNISQWTARKLDRKVTKETNDRYHADEDAGRYNKLLVDSKHLKELQELVGKARTLHYKLTRPWADEGPRILPNVLFSKFSDEFRTLKRDFAEAADKFAAKYPDYVAERKVKLNGLFNEKDYPSAEEIRSKFHLDLTILPFPAAEDFRSDLDEETVAEIKQKLTENTDNVLSGAMKHTAKQITDVVGNLAKRLKEYEPGEGKKLYASLVDNVRELAELLPAFNLTSDPALDAITKRIQAELTVEDSAALKENEHARASVAQSADEIVAAVGALFG